MKRSRTTRLALLTALLALPLCFPSATHAARKPTGSRDVTAQSVAVSPSQTLAPVTSTSGLHVCLSGFSAGNFVSVAVPLTGTPENHSSLGMSRYIDATGGFCFDAPPAGRTLTLAPGTYSIDVFWARDGSGAAYQKGPSASFSVMGK